MPFFPTLTTIFFSNIKILVATNPSSIPTATTLNFNPKENPWSRPYPKGNFGDPLKAICLKIAMTKL